MSKYLDQHVFNKGAYLLASCILAESDGTNDTMEKTLQFLVNSYADHYRKDITLESQWRVAAARIASTIEDWSKAPERVPAYGRALYAIAGIRNPDGSLRKKPLLNGTWFAQSHPQPEQRVEMCWRDAMAYLVALDAHFPHAVDRAMQQVAARRSEF